MIPSRQAAAFWRFADGIAGRCEVAQSIQHKGGRADLAGVNPI